MGHYELRGRERVWIEDAEGTPPPPPTSPTKGYNSISWSEPRTYNTNLRTYNTNLGSKFFAIFLPIIAFIIGQIIQYVNYSNSQVVLLLDLIFPCIPLYILIISTVLNLVNTVLITIWAWRLADDDEIGYCWWYIIISGLFLSIIPCICGFLGIIITIGVAICLENYAEEHIPLIISITFVVAVSLAVWIGVSNNGLKGVKPTRINSFSEIQQYVNSEEVALDISKMDEGYCGTITTGENCNSLIIIGKRNKTYRGLKIVTNASEIAIININISNGYFNFTSDECTLKILGRNSIDGIDGSFGGTGGNGSDGKPAIVAKKLVMTGNGRITLTAGNGGNGGNGYDGDSTFLFGNGDDGGNGGNGGDSAFVVSCSILKGVDFTGVLTLKKGEAGNGGRGGKGGSGGIFGSNGNNGYSGRSGKQNDYCDGSIELEGEHIIFIE